LLSLSSSLEGRCTWPASCPSWLGCSQYRFNAADLPCRACGSLRSRSDRVVSPERLGIDKAMSSRATPSPIWSRAPRRRRDRDCPGQDRRRLRPPAVLPPGATFWLSMTMPAACSHPSPVQAHIDATLQDRGAMAATSEPGRMEVRPDSPPQLRRRVQLF